MISNVASDVEMRRAFSTAGGRILRRSYRSSRTWMRNFVSHFGVDVQTCVVLWNRVISIEPFNFEKRHLLFALLMLKSYVTESIAASLCDVDEKTYRHYAWCLIEKLSLLDIVSFPA